MFTIQINNNGNVRDDIEDGWDDLKRSKTVLISIIA